MWETEPDSWSKLVFVAAGDVGWIQVHDLCDGFTNLGQRSLAVEWAESWMHARERQLCSFEPVISKVVGDALARFAAKQAEDDAKVRADPIFQRFAKESARSDAAEQAVATAIAPLLKERDKYFAALSGPGSVPPETDEAIRALNLRIDEVRLATFAAHGYGVDVPPKSPAELLNRLKAIELDWVFDLREAAGYPQPTEFLWRHAQTLVQQHPFLPPLPDKPDDGRQRYAALVRWCMGQAVTSAGGLGVDTKEPGDVGAAVTPQRFPVSWYNNATRTALYPALLRRALSERRITGVKPAGRHLLDFESVKLAYPQYAPMLDAAIRRMSSNRNQT
jgi:hypothetical protein